MNINLPNRLFFIHFTLFFGVYLLPGVFVIPLIIVALTYSYWNNNKVGVLIVGLYAISCKTEIAYYAYILMLNLLFFLDLLPIKPTSFQYRFRRGVLLLVGYLCVIYLSNILFKGSVLSLPFYGVTFLSSFILPFYIWKSGFKIEDTQEVFNHILIIALVQFVIAFFFQVVPIGIQNLLNSPVLGDRVVGTTSGTRTIATLLIVSIIPYLYSFFDKGKREQLLISVIFISFTTLIFLNDAKLSLYSAVLSFVAIVCLKFIRLYWASIKKILILCCLTALVVLNKDSIGKIYTEKYQQYYEYLDILGKYNNKLMYYRFTFSTETRSKFEYIFGTGGGTNGSRAANALAYNTLAKGRNSLTLPGFIPPYSDDFTRKYLAGLYDFEYAETTGHRSAVLGNPFNSVCAFYVELGVVGSLIFLIVLYNVVQFALTRNSIFSNVLLLHLFTVIIMSFLFPSFESGPQLFILFMLIGFIGVSKED